MPSTYSPDLRVQLMANGENSGTWGTITNTNLGTVIEDAISGAANVTVVSSSQALTAQNGLADEARCSAIILTTSLTAGFTVYVPPVTKLYVIVNNSNYTATIRAATSAGGTTPSGGLALAIPANSSCLVRCDGTNIREQLNTIVGDLTVNGTFTTAGSVAANGNLIIPNSAFLGRTQSAAISVATPSVVTVLASPVSGAAISFYATGGTLPTAITEGTIYYVSRINATTFNFSASSTLTPLIAVTDTGSGTFTVSTISTAPTPSPDANDTQIATTAFAKNAALGGGTLLGAQNFATPITLASASTVDLGTAESNVINITGTTTINSFGTIAAGAVRIVNFSTILTLTYNATSMILPGASNLTTAPNDVGMFESLGSGNWKCVSYTQSASLGGVPAGTVINVAMPTAPAGYLKANGAAVSRTGYAALFAAIGVTFGAGDGSTTFNLPDLRGRFTRNWADSGSIDAGRAFGSTQTDAFQNFSGSASFTSGASGTTLIAGTSGAIFTSGGVGFAPTGSAGFSGARTFTVDPSTQAGVRTAAETRPTNIALLACIKH